MNLWGTLFPAWSTPVKFDFSYCRIKLMLYLNIKSEATLFTVPIIACFRENCYSIVYVGLPRIAPRVFTCNVHCVVCPPASWRFSCGYLVPVILRHSSVFMLSVAPTGLVVRRVCRVHMHEPRGTKSKSARRKGYFSRHWQTFFFKIHTVFVALFLSFRRVLLLFAAPSISFSPVSDLVSDLFLFVSSFLPGK